LIYTQIKIRLGGGKTVTELTPQTFWDLMGLKNIVERWLPRLTANFDPKILAILITSLHNDSRAIRCDGIIAKAIDRVVALATELRRQECKLNEINITGLCAALEELGRVLESRSEQWTPEHLKVIR
jgi:hypothetical protein